MGGAKFMGRDYGMPYSKEQMAFECFFYWLIVGWLISLVLCMLIFPTPNFSIPILFYFVVVVVLFVRYINIEKRKKRKNGERI